MGLATFLALLANVWLLKGFDITPLVVGSLRVVGLHLISILSLMALKMSLLGVIFPALVGLGPLHPEAPKALYFLFHLLWAALYNLAFRRLDDKAKHTPIQTLRAVVPGGRLKGPNKALGWTILFLGRSPLAVGACASIFFFFLLKMAYLAVTPYELILCPLCFYGGFFIRTFLGF